MTMRFTLFTPLSVYRDRSSFITGSALVPDKAVSSKPGFIDPSFDDAYWQQYSAFWAEIEQFCVRAMAGSLSSIKSALDGLGIAYSDNGYTLTAELTVEQLEIVAELPPVQSIYEENAYNITDEAVVTRGSMTKGKTLAPMMTEDSAGISSSKHMPVAIGVTAMFAGAFAIVRRRIV